MKIELLGSPDILRHLIGVSNGMPPLKTCCSDEPYLAAVKYYGCHKVEANLVTVNCCLLMRC